MFLLKASCETELSGLDDYRTDVIQKLDFQVDVFVDTEYCAKEITGKEAIEFSFFLTVIIRIL